MVDTAVKFILLRGFKRENDIEFIEKSQMLEVIDNEIALCKKYSETSLAARFQIEREKINLS